MQFFKNIIENFRLSNTESPRVGSFAPKFSGPGINGEVISLEGIKSKYILIDFWASWCAPCRVENPDLADLLNVYSSDDFSIVGISLDMNLESWKRAIEIDGGKYWMFRQQALILARLDEKEDAILASKNSLKLAKEAGNQDYIRLNNISITEWSK